MSDVDLIRENNRLREIIENLVEPEVGRWITWTPTVDQGGAVTADVIFARYIVMSDLVILTARLDITGTGTAPNDIVVAGIPATIQPINFSPSNVSAGNAIIKNNVTFILYSASVNLAATDDIRFVGYAETSFIGNVPNFALASGDVISFTATYER